MDERTIQAARRGDRLALAALLNGLQDAWFRFILGLLHDRDLAEDATQETGLRFLKLLPTFRGDSQLRTWSLGIALNVVREMRRRKRPVVDQNSESVLSMVNSLAVEPKPGEGPVRSTERAEEVALVATAMDCLSDRQREAVVLRFFEEMSVEQTAEVMNCAEGTVKATVHQALKVMRSKLPQSWSVEP